MTSHASTPRQGTRSRHVGFRLIRLVTGRGTANNAENANGALELGQGQTSRQRRTNFHLRVCVICGSLALRRCNRLCAMTLKDIALPDAARYLPSNGKSPRAAAIWKVESTERHWRKRTCDSREAQRSTSSNLSVSAVDLMLLPLFTSFLFLLPRPQVLAGDNLAAPSAARYAMRPPAIVATTHGTFGSTRIRSARNPSAIAPRSERAQPRQPDFLKSAPTHCDRSSTLRPARIKAARIMAG